VPESRNDYHVVSSGLAPPPSKGSGGRGGYRRCSMRNRFPFPDGGAPGGRPSVVLRRDNGEAKPVCVHPRGRR
jgi:hypothetical protein